LLQRHDERAAEERQKREMVSVRVDTDEFEAETRELDEWADDAYERLDGY
jgi:hypothetical protein